MSAALRARLRALCAQADEAAAGGPAHDEARAITARLDSPLRVAIAGRVKAGKSTLLNALVGERLAPTDAGECTRLVTWFKEGVGYGVQAHLRDGGARELDFDRHDAALRIELRGLDVDTVERLEVSWPSSALRRTTLIDTPGLAGHDEAASHRAERFLGVEEDHASDADAVVYLMRHLHRRDAEFLETFVDRSIPHASPANAIGVLSRADEIGAGRPDAMASAGRIAERYSTDRRVRAMCATVVPVAGLLAETAQTLTEAEVASLRELAGLDGAAVEDLLVSADRFLGPTVLTPSISVRTALVQRLGMFGLRRSVAALRAEPAMSAPQLARGLFDLSGLAGLRELLEQHFVPRADALKARSALQALARLATMLATDRPDDARRLRAAIEETAASAHELAEMRLLHLVMTGLVELADDEVEEVRRVTAPGDLDARLGAEGGDDAALTDAALDAIGRWRSKAASPMADPLLTEACETVARSYEALYVAARGSVSA